MVTGILEHLRIKPENYITVAMYCAHKQKPPNDSQVEASNIEDHYCSTN